MQPQTHESDTLEGPQDARAFLISNRGKVQIAPNAVNMTITMRTPEQADRFASSVEACGGEIASRKPLGRQRGWRFEFTMPVAWDAFFGGQG